MKTKKVTMTPIYVMGKKFEVPEALTIMKALEFAGFVLKRGCGCRGGVCGACATVYRKKGDYHITTGLACQTVIEAEMNLVQLPYISSHKSFAKVRDMNIENMDLVNAYPELMRCMGCNTCTKSCPVNLSVMDYVSAAIRGNLEKVVELSIDCVMCGLCAARCPAELTPYNIALIVRRMYGIHMLKTTPEFQQRLDDINKGDYKAELTKLKTTGNNILQEIFNELQTNKGASV